ncbi:MAG: hypothetical protein JSU86_03035 [Phycisphaerales bacterium]|nr:MAG: hypothetical protein JSU86_03035 [Phycisphaerales bacterium]
MNTVGADEWPARPASEVFPELLDSMLVAQLLLYDRRPGVTPEQARRSIRGLVKKAGLPTLGRIGSGLLFRRDAVIAWLENRGNGVDATGDGGRVDDA